MSVHNECSRWKVYGVAKERLTGGRTEDLDYDAYMSIATDLILTQAPGLFRVQAAGMEESRLRIILIQCQV
jgi:hypothetical protein